MHYQGPKEYQNRAHGSNFSTLKWPWRHEILPEKSLFWLFSQFLPICFIQRTHKPVKTNLPIKLPPWGYQEYHIWPCGTIFRYENAHILPWKLPEKWIFRLFSQFLITFCIQLTQKPVETNLAIKIPHWKHKGHNIWPVCLVVGQVVAPFFIHFSGNFHGWIWAFSYLKIVPQGQIW